MTVWSAIVPLYRKLRLTAEDLVLIACALIPMVSYVTRIGDELLTDLRFCLGGSYLSEILVGELTPERKRALLQTCRLPRYVGVVRFLRGREWLLDVVCDTTDIYREAPKHGAIVAIVAREAEVATSIEQTLRVQYSASPQVC